MRTNIGDHDLLDLSFTDLSIFPASGVTNPAIRTAIASVDKEAIYSSVVMNVDQLNKFRNSLLTGTNRQFSGERNYQQDPRYPQSEQGVDMDYVKGGSKAGVDKTHLIKRAWFEADNGKNVADLQGNIVFYNGEANRNAYARIIEGEFEKNVDTYGESRLTVIPAKFRKISMTYESDGKKHPYQAQEATSIYYNISSKDNGGKNINKWKELVTEKDYTIIRDVNADEVLGQMFINRGISLNDNKLIAANYFINNPEIAQLPDKDKQAKVGEYMSNLSPVDREKQIFLFHLAKDAQSAITLTKGLDFSTMKLGNKVIKNK